jgi:hypothetical protein
MQTLASKWSVPRKNVDSSRTDISVVYPPLQTDISRFCELKYLLEKDTHNKNEDNYMVCLSKFLSEHYKNLSESYMGRPPPPERLTD